MPKKSLGQHWLTDNATLNAICDAVDVKEGEVILEIGPGLGTLTEILLQRGAKVRAVEYDKALIPMLHKKFVSFADNFQLEEGDILNYNFDTLSPGYKVVANIPYYLTSNLLRKLCETANPFSDASLLIQKEVAERVAASPGNMSLLSISVQLYCDVSLGPVVPAALFEPPPKVDSQVLILKHQGNALYDDINITDFFRLIKAGFSERRKKLRSSLSGGLRISKEQADEFLHAAKIDPNLRAQNLSLEDWYRLYKVSL